MAEFENRRWTSSDGLDLHLRDYAPPPSADRARLPLVCLHGLTRNARDFEEVAPALAATGRRVIVPDVRGRGASAWDPHPMNYAPPVYARDVVEMCAALGVERASFVGTSMGGLITLVLAAAAPALVADAALNDIGPVLDSAGLQRIGAYTGAGTDAADWSGAADYVRTANAGAFPHHGPADWDRFARRVFREDGTGRPVLDYDPAIATPMRAAAAAGAPPPDLWSLFDALAQGRRLLLVRGALSDLLSRGTADAMAARAPSLMVAEVPDVGHAPALTEPAAHAALMRWLAEAR